MAAVWGRKYNVAGQEWLSQSTAVAWWDPLEMDGGRENYSRQYTKFSLSRPTHHFM
ncbi:hypothetical protein COLO4_27028 [Corchorus olitorius]|uniref:Uncharacterized protein n=1 Tax=Corchorus olitorius TaxID=93759 RepID=A0A1R3HT50_9ROSI|nr:hypothetical protein COLO4_27028 [Corchorus olitorius]